MNNRFYEARASDDFNKARLKEVFSRIVHLLSRQKSELLSYSDVKSLLRPKAERYRGMQVVPVSRIVGSEGRYRDFNKAFLPKYEYLRSRWELVDQAHLKDIILPPIKLYKVGEVYFVRDGNHRVSVAKAQGIVNIDAEVTELTAEFTLKKSMTKDELAQELLGYEKEKFVTQTHLDTLIPLEHINFSTAGRFDEIITHIQGHKYYINQGQKQEISFNEAAISWYYNIFLPIIETISRESMVSRFPNRTRADLYMWIVQHWDDLKKKYGEKISIQEAARDFSNQFGKSLWQQFLGLFKPKK